MILSARENNVISVDLQHGGQGKNHLGYAQFIKMPKGARTTYSTLFLVLGRSFGQRDQVVIQHTASMHKVIQRGHPWFDYLKSLQWPSLDNINDLVVLTASAVR